MHSCPDCTQAEQNPHWGGFTGACRACQTRALAGSPLAHDAARGMAGSSRAFFVALQRIWPEDAEEGRRQVRKWFDAMQVGRS